MTESRAAIVHAAALSTDPALACARTDLHTAVQADDEHHHRQYALSARDSAAGGLLEPQSTPLERDYARMYFEDADAMIAKPTGTQPVSAWRPL
jgi:hypothetical protein